MDDDFFVLLKDAAGLQASFWSIGQGVFESYNVFSQHVYSGYVVNSSTIDDETSIDA